MFNFARTFYKKKEITERRSKIVKKKTEQKSVFLQDRVSFAIQHDCDRY